MTRKLLTLVTVLGVCSLLALEAGASPYFRFMGMRRDPATGEMNLHPTVGNGFSVDPSSPKESAGISDLAIITHDTADGTLMPKVFQPYVPPFAWSPLTVWYGGSFRGQLNGGFGTSFNVAPAIANLLMSKVDGASSPWLIALKTAMTAESGKQLRLGYGFSGNMISDGRFNSLNAAFPGNGFSEVVGRASRIMVGIAY